MHPIVQGTSCEHRLYRVAQGSLCSVAVRVTARLLALYLNRRTRSFDDLAPALQDQSHLIPPPVLKPVPTGEPAPDLANARFIRLAIIDAL